MKPQRRSPLKSKPLRNPGQSLDEQRNDLFDNKVLPPLVVALFLLMLAAMEWYRHWFPSPPRPIFLTVVAVLAIVYASFRIWRLWPHLKALRLGRDGERAVGQFLERLRQDGYQVFHDLIGTGFNVDHVVIGPAGVFMIETKTYSKPGGADAKVVVTEGGISIAGHEPERNPIVQAKAQAAWLRELLFDSTGRKLDVKAVVLFPGWFVEQNGFPRDVWVLEPKALPAFLQRERAVLTPEDVKLASFHISRFIRSIDTA